MNHACQKINNEFLIYALRMNLDKSRGLLKRISSIQYAISYDRVIWQPSIKAGVLVTSSEQ